MTKKVAVGILQRLLRRLILLQLTISVIDLKNSKEAALVDQTKPVKRNDLLLRCQRAKATMADLSMELEEENIPPESPVGRGSGSAAIDDNLGQGPDAVSEAGTEPGTTTTTPLERPPQRLMITKMVSKKFNEIFRS